MINPLPIPEEFLDGGSVEKQTLEGIDEIQYLRVSPHTSIKKHGHEEGQWEIHLLFVPFKRAYVCLKGEEHELVNNSSRAVHIMAIKGHSDYTYDDLGQILYALGFSVSHDSLIITD